MTPGLLAIALAASVSSSKLGVVVAGDLGPASTPASQILAACPRLAVFPLNAGNRGLVAAQVVAYKQSCVGAKAVLQVGGRGLTVNAATASGRRTTRSVHRWRGCAPRASRASR